MHKKSNFIKPPLSVDSQIQQLQNRGLMIKDVDFLKWALIHIGYYRLSGYWKIYEEKSLQPLHKFKSDTHFPYIIKLYDLDRKLRLHFLDALERIEVSIKSIINNHMSVRYSAAWYTEKSCYYENKSDHIYSQLLDHKGFKDPQHKFIKHFRQKYQDNYPPSWMAFEVINFGEISKIYSCLRNNDAKIIADNFCLSPRILKSWLRSMTLVRNICAHHGRLWNREITILPEMTKELKFANFKRGQIGEQILMIYYFLNNISPTSNWLPDFEKLLKKHSSEITYNMGLKDNWSEIIKKSIS